MGKSSKILEEFRRRTPGSARLAERAQQVFPSGVTHDSRFLEPYSLYVERARAARKWDVDGNEYVDYAGGHGALLLGHSHPDVTAAVQAQLEKGTHFGSGHELEVRWGETVKRLIPCADRVRFTASGTEATMLAIRVARAYTGRNKVLRFSGHFHGWHDHAAFGVASHFDGTPTPGVLASVAHEVALAPAGDAAATEQLLANGEIAAAILEPTGASWGKVPLPERFLGELRELCYKYEVPLIFDEVISGFRCAPGGAQGHYGVTPDLTTLAKILAGGFPGGALVGKREIMEALSFTPEGAAPSREKIGHQGTFNANPISATAGIATLEIVESTDACERANQFAKRLREELERVLVDERVNWYVYGSFSGFHIFTNPENLAISRTDIEAGKYDHPVLKAADRRLVNLLRLAMLINGVELFVWPGGPTSAAHTDEDLAQTVSAFRASLRMLRDEGEI